MIRLPQPGQFVRWRNPRHARALGWSDALGHGPFLVLGIVDRSQQGLPHGLVLDTRLGAREINEVWMI
jgi:hypothetical protein